MSLIKKIFGRTSGSSFNRYYGTILRSGAGYPTADEARRDMMQRERQNHPFGWPM